MWLGVFWKEGNSKYFEHDMLTTANKSTDVMADSGQKFLFHIQS